MHYCRQLVNIKAQFYYRKKNETLYYNRIKLAVRDNSINFIIEQTCGYKPQISTNWHNILMKFEDLYGTSQMNMS